MKTVSRSLALALLLALLAGCATDAPAAKYRVAAVKESPSGKEPGFRPYYFVSMFYESIVLPFSLMTDTNKDEIRNACISIYRQLQTNDVVEFGVPRYDGRQELKFIFKYLRDKDSTTLLCMANYLAKEKRICAIEDGDGQTWAILYYVVGNALIEHKAPKDAKNSGDKVSYANSMLSDWNLKNDEQIPDLVKAAIGGKDVFAHVVLSQYYLSIGESRKALDTMAAIRDVVVKAKDADDTLMFNVVLEEATAVDLILNPKP